jgi:hypothetical protein
MKRATDYGRIAAAICLVSGLALGLAACGTSQQTNIANVSASEAALAGSGHAALAYLQLPVCTGTNGPICSNPTIKAQIKLAYDQAYSAVTAAQTVADSGGNPDMTAATAALTALQNVLLNLPKTTAAN